MNAEHARLFRLACGETKAIDGALRRGRVPAADIADVRQEVVDGQLDP